MLVIVILWGCKSVKIFYSDVRIFYSSQREVPESFKKLRGLVSFTEEEIAKDERLAYIMGR